MQPATLLPVPSAEQAAVIDAVEKWAKAPHGPPELSLGGLAGTGKTTCIHHLLRRFERHDRVVWVCSLTGKACHVLRRKGVDRAATLHSTFYNARRAGDGSWSFDLKPRDELYCHLLIVDEASMVPGSLYDDLLSIDGMRILWVGDHGQLEPVGDDPHLMLDPDLRLETIHRQAATNPIITFAHALRNGVAPSVHVHDLATLGQLTVADRGSAGNFVDSVDQVVVSFNSTRFSINNLFREHLGHTGVLVPGDRLICLRNNMPLGLFNGMQATVLSVSPSQTDNCTVAEVRTEDGRILSGVKMVTAQFGSKPIADVRSITRHRDATLWDYAWAITAHKAQGSEWPRVLVIEEPSSLWDMNRWAYTAATRAAEQLIYCTDR